jgi:Domain of unknown function (DUF4400)
MIRVVTAASLLGLLALVLYLPAANAPEVFLRQVTVEHETNLRLLGPDAALRILDRMRFLQGRSASANPIPSTFRDNPGPPPVDVTVARHVSAASARILESQYVTSMEALLALSLFRIASLADWLPLVSAFLFAAIFDGLIRRAVKSKEFLRHDPELFAVHVCLAVLTICGLALSVVLPMTLHPYTFASAPLLAALFSSQAITNFHARG